MSANKSQEFVCLCIGEVAELQPASVLLGRKQAFVKPAHT